MISKKLAEKIKNKPRWRFGLKEAEGRKHRMVRAVEGKMSSAAQGAVRGAYTGVCHGLKMGPREEEQRKICKTSMERQVHGGTICNVLSMWLQCAP